MEELIEAKRRLQTLFEEFVTLPSYGTEDRLKDAIKEYRRTHQRMTEEDN